MASNKNSSNTKNIIYLFGKPGAGKGTVSSLIKQWYRAEHIVASKLLFQYLESAFGQDEINSVLSGNLKYYPYLDNLIFQQIVQSSSATVIVDGYPRMTKQMNAHMILINAHRDSFNKIILHLAIDDNVAQDRINYRLTCQACGATYSVKVYKDAQCAICNKMLIRRPDDCDQAFDLRIKAYHQTYEAMIHMQQLCNYCLDINANGSPEQVSAEVHNKLSNVLGLL